MKTTTPDQVEIRIPRRAEFVRVARMATCAVASRLDFTVDIIKDIELAVGEACANAVEHVPGDAGDEVVVKFIIDETQITVEVFDHGEGFDPERAAQVSIDDWDEPGGLGLVLIRELMDELVVDCDPESGTCVRMVKRRSR